MYCDGEDEFTDEEWETYQRDILWRETLVIEYERCLRNAKRILDEYGIPKNGAVLTPDCLSSSK